MRSKLLIIVPEEEVLRLEQSIAALASNGWSNSIHVASGPVSRYQPLSASDVSQRIIEHAYAYGATETIVAKNILCDSHLLRQHHELNIRRLSLSLIRRDLRDRIEDLGLLWRKSLAEKLRGYSQKKTDPDHWLKQFEQFGYRWVGEGVLRQFEVVSPDELGRAVRFPIQAKMASPLRFAVALETGDLGASAFRLGGVLAQTYGADQVMNLPDALQAYSPTEKILICEDGLWTGTELHGLLTRFAAGGDLEHRARGRRILLHYCVTTDYGILVCRNLLRHLGLEATVELSSSSEQRLVEVLSRESQKNAEAEMSRPPADFQALMAGHVRPLAFQDARLWAGRQDEARGICEQIGRQLVEQYSRAHSKSWSEDVLAGFALGAGRFGSTIAFSHGTPKVCLPVFWLGGNVTLRGVTVDWRPLVHDERRLRHLDHVWD